MNTEFYRDFMLIRIADYLLSVIEDMPDGVDMRDYIYKALKTQSGRIYVICILNPVWSPCDISSEQIEDPVISRLSDRVFALLTDGIFVNYSDRKKAVETIKYHLDAEISMMCLLMSMKNLEE